MGLRVGLDLGGVGLAVSMIRPRRGFCRPDKRARPRRSSLPCSGTFNDASTAPAARWALAKSM